jgi:hypothetical protein
MRVVRSDLHVQGVQPLCENFDDPGCNLMNVGVLNIKFSQSWLSMRRKSAITYPQVNRLEDNIQPRETVVNICVERRRDCNTDRERHDGGKPSQVRWVEADKEVVEQIGLLTRLKPLQHH